jgi:hypothetical protein
VQSVEHPLELVAMSPVLHWSVSHLVYRNVVEWHPCIHSVFVLMSIDDGMCWRVDRIIGSSIFWIGDDAAEGFFGMASTVLDVGFLTP